MPQGFGCDHCGDFIPTPTGDQIVWQVARHSGAIGLFGQASLDTQNYFFCSLRCLGVWTAARPEFVTTTHGGHA